MALCHRLWGCNDFKYILKQVPEDIIPSWPEESVWPNTMHTFHLHMCFICAKDDAWIQLLIISEHAPLPNQLWTSPLDFLFWLWIPFTGWLWILFNGWLWIPFTGWLWHCSWYLLTKTETLCVEALAVKLLPCCAHAADISVYQFSWSQSNHLVDSHCSRDCWYLLWHFLHCTLNILILHKEQFHCCVCLGQGLVCIRENEWEMDMMEKRGVSHQNGVKPSIGWSFSQVNYHIQPKQLLWTTRLII